MSDAEFRTERPADGEGDRPVLLPLSGLQHLMFCERQAALIHVERQWRENRLTLEGTHLHRRADETGPRCERRGDLLIARGVRLCSRALGLVGRADVVEFRRVAASDPGGEAEEGSAELVGQPGRWMPFPVDYKRGRPKRDRCDEVQLCAQAMCLEEMLGAAVSDGALYYGKDQRRTAVTFDVRLRQITCRAAERYHRIVEGGVTPRRGWRKACERCSLMDACLPRAASGERSALAYVDRAMRSALGGGRGGG